MTSATAFPEPFGWDYFTNESNFNIIKGSRYVWENSSNGYAFILVQLAIIFMVTYIIYSKTQNWFVAAFGQLLITMVMAHYGWIQPVVARASYITVVVIIGISITYYIKKKGS